MMRVSPLSGSGAWRTQTADTTSAPSVRTIGEPNSQKPTDWVQGRVACCGIVAMVIAHPEAVLHCPRCGAEVVRT